jgi:hypothetical protein
MKYAYYVAYLLVYVGFLFHRSEEPVFLLYSGRHLAALCVLTLPFGLPRLLRRLRRRRGLTLKRAASAGAPALAGIFVFYLGAMQVYYYRQMHLFDPFVQVPPVRLSLIDASQWAPENRILALGGSTTECSGLPEPQRYPARLSARLSGARSENPAVMNAGRSWYTTRHSLINYTSYYQIWRPRFVVVMHALNDLVRSFSPEPFALGPYNDLYSHYYGAAYAGARPPTFEQFWLRRLFPYAPWSYWYSEIVRPLREVDYPLDRYASLVAFERNLRHLAAAVRASQATLVLVTEPSLYKESMNPRELRVLWFARTLCNQPRGLGRYDVPSARSLSRAMAAFNDRIRAVAREEGAILADAEMRVPKDLRYIYDDCHFTTLGADAVAGVVARAVAGGGPVGQPQIVGR